MRIRTIKPEFWTDEKIGELSIPARLLFIALFNYADDEGNFPCQIKQIKIYSFPYDDDIDILLLLAELTKLELLAPYVVNGKSYLSIKNFKKHQKINRPSPALHPSFTDNSVSNHLLFIDDSQRKEGRKERKGEERKGEELIKKIIIPSFDDIKQIFQDQKQSGAEEFYSKMETLQWKNKNGKIISNPISYVLKSIEAMKNENHERSNRSIVKTTKLTRAEQRKLDRKE